jgi:hypothetical protein
VLSANQVGLRPSNLSLDGDLGIDISKDDALFNMVGTISRESLCEASLPTNLHVSKKVADGFDCLHYPCSVFVSSPMDKVFPPGVNIARDVLNPSHNSKVRRTQCWKVKIERKKKVVGDDVAVGSIPKLLGRTTMGRFCGKIMSPVAFQS